MSKTVGGVRVLCVRRVGRGKEQTQGGDEDDVRLFLSKDTWQPPPNQNLNRSVQVFTDGFGRWNPQLHWSPLTQSYESIKALLQSQHKLEKSVNHAQVHTQTIRKHRCNYKQWQQTKSSKVDCNSCQGNTEETQTRAVRKKNQGKTLTDSEEIFITSSGAGVPTSVIIRFN